MIGMTQPYTARWRMGGDFRLLNTSGIGAVGILPAAPGTGNMYIYSVQAIGNNLILENDLGMMSASYINAQPYKGQSLSYIQTETLRQRWRLDVSLQLYNQNDNIGVHHTRVTPSFKLNYHLNDSVSFEGEGGIENSHTSSATQNEKSQRQYFYVGYRWDFR
jgi:hypothetical protein